MYKKTLSAVRKMALNIIFMKAECVARGGDATSFHSRVEFLIECDSCLTVVIIFHTREPLMNIIFKVTP